MLTLTLGAATFNYLNRFSLNEALDHLAQCGFHRIELMSTPPHLFPRDIDATGRKRIRQALDAGGLELESLQPTYLDLNLISVNPAIREETVRQVLENIELAADLGARMLVLVTGRRHPLLPMPIEIAWNLALDNIRRCNERARKCGVILGLENVRNQFVDRSADLRRMVEDLADDNVKAVIDVANANILESPVEALEAAKDHLTLVHISDNDGKTWTHSPIGAGNIDFAAVASKLREIGFKGCCILEVTHDQDPAWAMEESKSRLEALGWKT
jgi:L-ribulose-5-phosphate 3-epimerase